MFALTDTLILYWGEEKLGSWSRKKIFHTGALIFTCTRVCITAQAVSTRKQEDTTIKENVNNISNVEPTKRINKLNKSYATAMSHHHDLLSKLTSVKIVTIELFLQFCRFNEQIKYPDNGKFKHNLWKIVLISNEK